MNHTVFTSESVSAGHADKICDQVSDAILDAVLEQDPYGRVAVETVTGKNRMAIFGEVSTSAKVDYQKIAKTQITRIGYIDPKLQFTADAPIDVFIHEQSPEISLGVVKQHGAGDQGMMFGYACKETPELMPLPIMLAHTLTRTVDELRIKKRVEYLRPDGKSQVTVTYENGKPKAIPVVVLAVPHEESITQAEVKEDLYRLVIQPVFNRYGFSVTRDQFILNGTGVWHMCGPATDTGLTGRKIVVDTYGGYSRVGGGCFSGKDPSKVDRSGAYAARYIAKNIVAHGLAERAEVSLAYYIGAQKPVMKEIETFGTANASDTELSTFADDLLDCSVESIIETLKLRTTKYLPTAAYGHFGREEFPWEQIV